MWSGHLGSSLTAVVAVAVCLLSACGNSSSIPPPLEETPPPPSCETDADCPEVQPYCKYGGCRICLGDGHCVGDDECITTTDPVRHRCEWQLK